MLALILPLILPACTDAKPGDDFFYYESAGAEMPVWVRGDPESTTYVIYIQGGPGNPSTIADAMFPQLAADMDSEYRMVYFDQRASGVSLGNAQPESLTLEQFTQDLDVLVDLLDERYEIEHLFLWGISWGGTLGNSYLLDPDRAAKITGWIEMDGGENIDMAYEYAVPQVLDFAQQQIDAGERVRYWEGAQEWYAERPLAPPAPEMIPHWDYVYDAGGYWHDPERGFESFLPYFFKGAMGMTAFSNQRYVDQYMDADEDLHPLMGTITLPTLMIWGRYDLVVPIEVGEESFSRIGTPEQDKRWVVLEDSAHTVVAEEPERCFEEMHSFIQDYTQ